jgi:hypothetical protein
MKNRIPFHPCIGVVLLTISLSTAVLAQPAPNRSRVSIVRVKAEMANEWLDLQKNEVVPALKKAGVTSRTVYTTGVFGNAGEYIVVQPMAKFAEFDSPSPQARALGPEGNARLGAKIRKCLESTTSFLSTSLADLSNPAPTQVPPAVIQYTRIRVAPGKMQEVQNLIKTEILPVYKKAKWGFTVSRRGIGANSNDLGISTPYAKFADLDTGSPLVRELGQDGSSKLLEKFTNLVTVVENVVRTRVADLSF